MPEDGIPLDFYWPQLLNFTAFGTDRDAIERSLALIAESWTLLGKVDQLTTVQHRKSQGELTARNDFNRDRCELLRNATGEARGRLELDLERKVRTLRESEQRIVQQRSLVDRRRARGADAQLSEALLANFEASVDIQRRDVARLRQLRKMPPKMTADAR